jgi:hypothetical protein
LEQLFDPDKPVARRTDPETSHEAADSVTDITAKQEAVLRALRGIGRATDVYLREHYLELSRYYPMAYPRQSESGLRSRRSELVDKGYVYDTGERDVLDSGRRAIVWEAR